MGRITKSLQLNEDTDIDILDWFSKIPEGQGQAQLKAVIRAGIAVMTNGDMSSVQEAATAPAAIDTGALATAIAEAFKEAGIGADISQAIREGLKDISLPIPVNGNSNGHRKKKTEPVADDPALAEATDAFLNMFG